MQTRLQSLLEVVVSTFVAFWLSVLVGYFTYPDIRTQVLRIGQYSFNERLYSLEPDTKLLASQILQLVLYREAHMQEAGEVVVTKDPAGHILAVTRQDAEGVILKVLAISTPLYNSLSLEDLQLFANDRPSEGEALYVWATDAEAMLRSLARSPVTGTYGEGLVRCRDIFSVPETDSELGRLWTKAMLDPAAVPDYIEGQVASLNREIENLELELRKLQTLAQDKIREVNKIRSNL